MAGNINTQREAEARAKDIIDHQKRVMVLT